MNPSSLIGHVTELLQRIENSNRPNNRSGGQPADRITAAFFKDRRYLGAKDRRVISESVFGIIRNRRYLEALFERYLEENPSHSDLDDQNLRFLPLYAIYAAVFQTSPEVPEGHWLTTFPKIPLMSFTEASSSYSSLEFITDHLIRLGVKYSFQDWMASEWSGQVGDQLEPLLRSLNAPPNITLRVNLLKITREECQLRLAKEGIETHPAPLTPAGLIVSKRFAAQASPAFSDGWYEIQDEGSQLVSLIADPKPGDIVIDACAGAGGKSLHLAELMKNDGELVAIDVEKTRLRELETRVRRADVHIIRTQLREEVRPENFAGKADLVLVDAPCSGVGTIRRNPGLKWSVSEKLVSYYSEKQLEILSYNSQFVKHGGKLIYATCSLFRKENEEVVKKFLAQHNEFSRSAIQPITGLESKNGEITLYPHIHNTDGFFVAILSKMSS